VKGYKEKLKKRYRLPNRVDKAQCRDRHRKWYWVTPLQVRHVRLGTTTASEMIAATGRFI